jgi:hypothetical protein
MLGGSCCSLADFASSVFEFEIVRTIVAHVQQTLRELSTGKGTDAGKGEPCVLQSV